MLKTISAALLAVSVLAAPVLAATGNTTKEPIIKTERVKPSVLNAKAEMGSHHVTHHRHHRFHKRMGALKMHKFSKVVVKHVAHTAKLRCPRQRARLDPLRRLFPKEYPARRLGFSMAPGRRHVVMSNGAVY